MRSLRSTAGGFVLLGAAAVWLAGCRADVRTAPPSSLFGNPSHTAPRAAETAAVVTRTGYTVQVGAFSVLDNAQRLTQALNALGLDAYLFPQGSGLYRVRFGDYSSRGEAIREAERLRDRAVVDDYYIIGPGSQALIPRVRPETGLRERLAATAESFLGVEYAWGGASRREGVDCSGLVQAVYRLNGLRLPRTMTDQYRVGTSVSRDRLRKGDLVFFSATPGRAVSHVGIYVGDDVFIHAPGTGKQVRQESLESLYFRTHFSGAKAYLD